MAVGHVPEEQGTATRAKAMGKGEKGVESAWRFSMINLERRSFVTAALALTLSGMAYWGAAGCNKEVAGWFFKDILVGNRHEGTKSWEVCMREGQ